MRFPGKLLADLGGLPVLVRTWNQAGAAGLDELLVATDDSRIEQAVIQAGGRVVMTAGTFRTGTDRIAEALRAVATEIDRPEDVIVNIQGDEPFLEPQLIAAVAAVLVNHRDVEMATAATPARPEERNNPNAVKVVIGKDGSALYFSRAAIPGYGAGYDAGGVPATLRHIGLYAYRRGLLERFVSWPPGALEQVESLEQLRALEHGTRIRVVVRPTDTFGIDIPEDLARARAFLADRGSTPGV